MTQGVIAIAGACLIFGLLGGSTWCMYESRSNRDVPKYFLFGFIVSVGVTLSMVTVAIGIWLLVTGVWMVVTG